MTAILLIGSDTALLEGVSQTLIAAGHRVTLATTVAEALSTIGTDRPMIALVERNALLNNHGALRIPLSDGGALLAYHDEETAPVPLPHSLRRVILADLQLPLERQRLSALVAHVENRARAVGRDAEGSREAGVD